LDAATWGAELALGEGPGRIYMVEPTGPIEDDPNLTDKKYPGNPTKSYRSRDPLRVTGEVTDWQGHSPEELKAMKDNLERLERLGIEAIEDRVRLVHLTQSENELVVQEEVRKGLALISWISRVDYGQSPHSLWGANRFPVGVSVKYSYP
jgi:hypothetical protein